MSYPFGGVRKLLGQLEWVSATWGCVHNTWRCVRRCLKSRYILKLLCSEVFFADSLERKAASRIKPSAKTKVSGGYMSSNSHTLTPGDPNPSLILAQVRLTNTSVQVVAVLRRDGFDSVGGHPYDPLGGQFMLNRKHDGTGGNLFFSVFFQLVWCLSHHIP